MIKQLVNDLRSLGIAEGDHVLVRVAARGMIAYQGPDGADSDPSADLVEALLESVGAGGTIAALTFTKTRVGWGRAPRYSSSATVTTGKFARAVLAHPQALRSRHPTNSFTAIGSRAGDLTDFHTEMSHPFRPVEDLVLLQGKMLLVGCATASPGFSTVHVAQHHLALSRNTLFAGIARARYTDHYQRERTYRKWDVPGCSMGFGKMYRAYRDAGLLTEGTVGGAESLLIGAAEALAVDRATLEQDPTAVLCDNLSCISCRASLYYNVRDWAPYWIGRFTPKRDGRGKANGQ